MPDIIHLLPDSVANQIAAGEVIQRPASVVKELIENALDAESTQISINIKDAGKTLIQVIDNGHGMSETDARMAFERHATSKIIKAEDLFAITTMGFRGEALASVAAISNVELRTKRTDDEIGTSVQISASKVISQEPCSCNTGSNFTVKNLFYNLPARRKFLKSSTTEFRNIIEEVQRTAFSHPEITFILRHNETEIFNLPASNLKQRIINVIGKNKNQNLITVNTETSIINIQGYIGKPEFAKKSTGEQYFFVNRRFMKHPYFYKALMMAYSKILPPDVYPSFYIFLTVNPGTIDVNIHPTKTEVKFENEIAIFQILVAATREALGKFNIAPSLDFNTNTEFQIPVLKKDTEIKMPEIKTDPFYNPFVPDKNSTNQWLSGRSLRDVRNLQNWETLYKNSEQKIEQPSDIETKIQRKAGDKTDIETVQSQTGSFFQYKNKYIMTPVKSGLMLIDQKRAHERILFENYLITLNNRIKIVQKSLYPVIMELVPADFELLNELIPEIQLLGFDIEIFGKNAIVINGSPSELGDTNPVEIIEHFLEIYKNEQNSIGDEINEKIACSLAIASSVNYGKKMTEEEMRNLIDRLFACTTPSYSPDGKPVITILTNEELEKRFKI
ncbi:MAG: DNA mismatch repair endonuclease MutL [Bacteroidia bacterium]|nr:DNA mismatch repair endonuclease MutL [Bacteroidia bacterium]